LAEPLEVEMVGTMGEVLTVAALAEQEKNRHPELGVYVHVPFCASTCDYCAFYQVRPEGDDLRRFIRTMHAEMDLVGGALFATTVFWGGGTPGLLPPAMLGELASVVRGRLAAAPVEWSVEMAPATVTRERLQALRDGGITRISIGVQSLDPGLLDSLGRRHTREQVLRAYALVREAGFENVNLDLIFAIPGQDIDAWRQDLEETVALEPEHISTYCLTFEEDTALFVKLSQGRVKIDPVKEAEFYEVARDMLGAAGYAQYEISNFARPGRASRHNLNTWAMQEWLGFGPSAASQHGGWRASNPSDLAAWEADIAAGRRATRERVALDNSILAIDSVVFGLRCNAGVDLTALRTRFPNGPWAAIDGVANRIAVEGLAVRTGTRLALTDRGRLLADAVGGEFIGLESAEDQ
jgi:oxygen-independent coproporphyrinogen-3 oxidase